MNNRAFLITIALIIGIPVVYAALGGSESAGLIIGVALVVGGLGWTIATRDRD